MHHIFLFIFFILLFLAGMFVLRTGLFNAAGSRLKGFLEKTTDKPWKGFIAGVFFTGILQSSSAVMVMAVGLVSAGALSFQRTIGIILGTNIGSTFTTEFMAFPLGRWVIPGVLIGAALVFIPRTLPRSLGAAFIGMSAIFAAMEGFKALSAPLSNMPAAARLLAAMEDHLALAVLAGIAVTAIIHSSSATVGMAMGFVSGGDLGLISAVGIMLGSNVGTCITGWLASLGAGREARLTAYAHIWLNIAGVAVFLPFTGLLAGLSASMAQDPAVQLAHSGVIFNVLVSLAVLPAAGPFARLIIRLHGRKGP